jgi:hypothetical protein
VWPKDFKVRGFATPRYCSARCAAFHALEQSMDARWCAVHACWYELGEGSCDACNLAAQLDCDEQDGGPL